MTRALHKMVSFMKARDMQTRTDKKYSTVIIPGKRGRENLFCFCQNAYEAYLSGNVATAKNLK